jgi:hypothetical protein
MFTNTLTQKVTGIYVAYAPEFDVSAWGACQDEAVNNLTEQLRERGRAASTGEERKLQP